MNFTGMSTKEIRERYPDEFIFGFGHVSKTKIYTWNPHDEYTQNAHMLIVGGSGSGKTHLARRIKEHIISMGIKLYTLDVHGDLETDGEKVFQFTMRENQYGLNPFEMEMDRKNGGPIAEVNIFLANIRKNFIPKLGTRQKSVLKQFLIDCYRYVGILDEDPETWNLPLPTMDDMSELMTKILNVVRNKSGAKLYTLLQKTGKTKEKIKYETNPEEIEKLQAKLNKEVEKLTEMVGMYTDYLQADMNVEMFDNSISQYVDIEFYLIPSHIKVFEDLVPYLRELVTSPLFKGTKPPAVKGMPVRWDISGLTNAEKPQDAMMFADLMTQRIFRYCKMRGEYSKKKNKRGKVDTMILLDESKMILPSGKDKENIFNIFNRLVTESRKYGLGLIIISQRPDHFSKDILSSIYTKIILRLSENDEGDAIKMLGVKDKHLFNHISQPYVALIGHPGMRYESVKLFPSNKTMPLYPPQS